MKDKKGTRKTVRSCRYKVSVPLALGGFFGDASRDFVCSLKGRHKGKVGKVSKERLNGFDPYRQEDSGYESLSCPL